MRKNRPREDNGNCFCLPRSVNTQSILDSTYCVVLRQAYQLSDPGTHNTGMRSELSAWVLHMALYSIPCTADKQTTKQNYIFLVLIYIVRKNSLWLCWCTPLVLPLGRQRQVNEYLRVRGQPGPHRKFHGVQDYIERLCLNLSFLSFWRIYSVLHLLCVPMRTHGYHTKALVHLKCKAEKEQRPGDPCWPLFSLQWVVTVSRSFGEEHRGPIFQPI